MGTVTEEEMARRLIAAGAGVPMVGVPVNGRPEDPPPLQGRFLPDGQAIYFGACLIAAQGKSSFDAVTIAAKLYIDVIVQWPAAKVMAMAAERQAEQQRGPVG